MNKQTDIATLIAYHTNGFRVPPSLEVRRYQWRTEAQARFDARGLPKGGGRDGE